MKEWYDNLSPRDQMLLLPLSLVLALFLLYGMVWAPVSNATQQTIQANNSARETLDWMRDVTQTIKRSRGGRESDSATRSLSALVDTTLPLNKLVMKRYQPIGEAGAQVWLEDAALPSVIAWLSALEVDHGLQLENISIVSSDRQGYVKTRVRLARG